MHNWLPVSQGWTPDSWQLYFGRTDLILIFSDEETEAQRLMSPHFAHCLKVHWLSGGSFPFPGLQCLLVPTQAIKPCDLGYSPNPPAV